MTIDKRVKYENLPSKNTGEAGLVAKGKKNRIEELLELEDWLNELDPKWWLPEEDDKQTAPSEDTQIQRRLFYKHYVDGGGELNFPNFVELIQGRLKKPKGITGLI